MPRRTADRRHLDSQPTPPGPRPDGPTVIEPTVDALVAVSHPLRRRLLDVLRLDGPASVGTLAERLGVAAGSVSHHVKPLHRSGFVEPAPELARDTRESWWRALPVTLSWSRQDFAPGTAGRQVADIAARVNLERQMELIRTSAEFEDHRVPGWERVGAISDQRVRATKDQVEELAELLDATVREWRARCADDATRHPDAERQPVLVASYVLPVRP